ncbi:gustatory receptor for bitter taste 22e-like [Zeugodacus cucurbitae]|uniref:gustatory receptor for bitter taste 22e-like n=1 Tax=Zeugodacus cucurbitae TaxID=28588 RepID=UPI0023D91B63|nr:gustatory receptor for bitter taste 22e-like [Zeugodacus cucurbitae]
MCSETTKTVLRQMRKLVADTCISTQFLFSTALGLFPYKYNTGTRRLTIARWLNYYWPLINIAIALMTLYIYFLKSKMNEIHFISDKPLNKLLAHIHYILGFCTLYVIVITNWCRRKELFRLHNELVQMQRRQQRWQRRWTVKSNNQIEAFYYNCIIAKSVMTLLQEVSSISGKMGINPHPSLKYVLYVVFMFAMKNVTYLTVTNFHFALLNIYRQLQQVNWNFQEVVRLWGERAPNAFDMPFEHVTDIAFDAGAQSHSAKRRYGRRNFDESAITDLCRQYVRICALAKRVCKHYEWQVLLFLAIILFGNVMSTFYFLVYLGGNVLPQELFSPTLFLQIYFINTLDLGFFMVICERSMASSKETGFLLKKLSQLKSLPPALQHEFEMLSIFMAGETVRFRFCGLVEWNFRTGASYMTATILYLIVLVQFDYYNL